MLSHGNGAWPDISPSAQHDLRQLGDGSGGRRAPLLAPETAVMATRDE